MPSRSILTVGRGGGVNKQPLILKGFGPLTFTTSFRVNITGVTVPLACTDISPCIAGDFSIKINVAPTFGTFDLPQAPFVNCGEWGIKSIPVTLGDQVSYTTSATCAGATISALDNAIYINIDSSTKKIRFRHLYGVLLSPPSVDAVVFFECLIDACDFSEGVSYSNFFTSAGGCVTNSIGGTNFAALGHGGSVTFEGIC